MAPIIALACAIVAIYLVSGLVAYTDFEKTRAKHKAWRDAMLRDGSMSQSKFDMVERYLNGD